MSGIRASGDFHAQTPNEARVVDHLLGCRQNIEFRYRFIHLDNGTWLRVTCRRSRELIRLSRACAK